MATFRDQDLRAAEFRESDLTGARFMGVVMQDVEIDGLIGNIVINGIEVTGFVEAELDRLHPVRLLMRSDDPVELREAHRQLREGWANTTRRLRGMPAGSEEANVKDEWSATQTLRHLVFVHDSWFRRCCLGSTELFTPMGLGPEFVPDQERQGLDRGAAPTLDEVLAVREDQGVELTEWLADVTTEDLAAPAPVPTGPGWPPYAAGQSVLQCLRVVFNEEWAHHQFCTRDLDLLQAVHGAARPPGLNS